MGQLNLQQWPACNSTNACEMDQALLADENVEDGPLATVISSFEFQKLICFYKFYQVYIFVFIMYRDGAEMRRRPWGQRGHCCGAPVLILQVPWSWRDTLCFYMYIIIYVLLIIIYKNKFLYADKLQILYCMQMLIESSMSTQMQ